MAGKSRGPISIVIEETVPTVFARQLRPSDEFIYGDYKECKVICVTREAFWFFGKVRIVYYDAIKTRSLNVVKFKADRKIRVPHWTATVAYYRRRGNRNTLICVSLVVLAAIVMVIYAIL